MEDLDLNQHLGHLCSAVGHHVINALSTIVSQGEILRSLESSAQTGSVEANRRIQTIVRTAMGASTITRRLIELSHDLTAIEVDHKPGALDEIMLDEWIACYLEKEKQAFGPAVTWDLDLAPVPLILGKPDALRTMFRLLLRNAVEAFEHGAGTIKIVSRSKPRNWLTVEIRDNGSGMSPEVLEHATEPFFTTRPDRLGVGLTIARGIWRRHRGTLTVESKKGEGTMICLLIPSHEAI